MQATVLTGTGKNFHEIPTETWKNQFAAVPEILEKRLAFMTPDHHRVRYFAVSELPRHGRPLPPEDIARRLDLPPDRVGVILEELEKNLFFLVRNDEGAVSWAFPVTADETRHRLRFTSGETLYAA